MKFLWGVATSSHQIEGGNIHNDWWAWEQAGNIETGEISGQATDHWSRYEEDLANAASLGLNSYRFSIEWSRCEPQEGKWDAVAFQWYTKLVTLCESHGLMPMVTLHHFTLPKWLAEKGGITHPHFPDRFAGFVRKVISHLGSRIPLWCTLNEPNALAIGAYMGGFMPPAQISSRKLGVAHRMLLKAHVKAYDLIHEKVVEREGPWSSVPLSVGFAHNLIDFQPFNARRLRDRLLTHFCRRYYNQAWLDAVTGRKQHFGIRGLLPAPKQVWSARGRKTVDFIGVNYYMRAYPFWGAQKEQAEYTPFNGLPIGLAFQKKEDTVSDLGWAIHPEGLGRILRFASGYGIPLYITENGIADASDVLRREYLESHLREVAAAKTSGLDIRGYFHWSLLDNFEWKKGFAPRFGLWEVDYATFERRPRQSAERYAQLIRQNESDDGILAGLL